MLNQADNSASFSASDQGEDTAVGAPLAIEHIRVRADRLELNVRVAHERYAQTNPEIIAACKEFAPTIALHTCRNSVGPTFGHVMNCTSVPHLLEHVIIDLQTRAAHDSSVVFAGTTEWDVERNAAHKKGSNLPLYAKVSVSLEDDVVALGAVKQAVDCLNRVLVSCCD